MLFNKFLSYFESKTGNPIFSPLKTFYLNFRLLSWKLAIKFPIYVYGRWNFRDLQGKIEIESENVYKGMIKLGFNLAGYVSTSPGTLTINKNSKIIFRGKCCIAQGVSLVVTRSGILELGSNVTIGDSVKIICYKNIKIGNRSGITWECQVMDFNSHYVEDMCTGKISRIANSIEIGEYCWICNRSTIMPGTKLPNRIIVASGSLLNKNYVDCGIKEYSLIGGCPAKLIKSNIRRLYNSNNEYFLNKHFQFSDEKCINRTELPIIE